MAGEQNPDTSLGANSTTDSACAAAVRENIEPVATAAGPDWDHQTEDIFCPLCEYNLRGLIEPRCLECGYRFEWPDLLDPRRRLHPYLFEHHP